MDDLKILEVKENVFKENEVNAHTVREALTKKKKLMINVMSSPGSGKTTTLVRLIKMLQPEIRVGVMECDIDASVDASTIIEAGGKSVQLHTGGMCHMDAQMTKQGLDALGIEDVDIIFIENIGNLVCPAEFDTGSHMKMTILSVPEGDDKPAKYPLMYKVSDLVLVNKIDALAVFDFNQKIMEERIYQLNPEAKIIYVSSKTGEGFNEFVEYVKTKVEAIKDGRC